MCGHEQSSAPCGRSPPSTYILPPRLAVVVEVSFARGGGKAGRKPKPNLARADHCAAATSSTHAPEDCARVSRRCAPSAVAARRWMPSAVSRRHSHTSLRAPPCLSSSATPPMTNTLAGPTATAPKKARGLQILSNVCAVHVRPSRVSHTSFSSRDALMRPPSTKTAVLLPPSPRSGAEITAWPSRGAHGLEGASLAQWLEAVQHGTEHVGQAMHKMLSRQSASSILYPPEHEHSPATVLTRSSPRASTTTATGTALCTRVMQPLLGCMKGTNDFVRGVGLVSSDHVRLAGMLGGHGWPLRRFACLAGTSGGMVGRRPLGIMMFQFLDS